VAPRALTLLVSGLGVALAATACTGDGEPPTSREVADVVAEHTGEPERVTADAYGLASEFDPEPVKASLEYAGDAEVQALVGTGFIHPDMDGCRSDVDLYCVELDDGVTLRWSLHDVGEDPGSVEAFTVAGDTTIIVSLFALLEGDPRELDLAITPDELAAAARDLRDRVS
jgi:hypothetical protein